MGNDAAIRLDDDERDAFLGNGGTGVISLDTAEGDPPHALPVSYGYDATTETFYFRLAVEPGTEKGELDDRAVSFVVHGESDGRWHSVVAEGRLDSTDDESVEMETLEAFDRIHIPLVDIFGEPPRTVSFEFYRLDPDRIGARTESSSGV
jgi:nitroimidazol reductase NimA-like FMN-containing flavoprotein (pyridoxamine 5'-phosphate oxidase superfamily)